jgi:hypothetical protein
MPEAGGSRRGLALAISCFLAVVIVVIALDLAAIPVPPPQGSGGSTYPANPHRLVSNNLKIADTLRLNLFTLPQTAMWMLASSNTGPSYVGPYYTDLGSDWFVLMGPVLMGGGVSFELLLPVPNVPSLTGLEFLVQCAVISPQASDVVFSNSVTLRGSQNGGGKNVLILRQTLLMAGMTTSAQQASALAASLQLLGNQVTVADDALPTSLLDYDCILDLRFTTPPAADESLRLVQFLRQGGGVFFLAGPYAGCPPGQQRALWLSTFLNTTLGVGVMISSGGSLSNSSVEAVDPLADPMLLTVPLGIASLPFNVSNEGGNFGPPGAAASGTPFVTGSTMFGTLVYGMFFESTAMMYQTVGGRVGVLFSGGADTLQPSPQNPYPDLIFCNVAWYLDR